MQCQPSCEDIPVVTKPQERVSPNHFNANLYTQSMLLIVFSQSPVSSRFI